MAQPRPNPPHARRYLADILATFRAGGYVALVNIDGTHVTLDTLIELLTEEQH